jgi:GNAT superfamily N-acetyltransferase
VTIVVREIQAADRSAWEPLWEGYNAFYGRAGATALPAVITQTLWQRLFDPAEPVFCLVAELAAPSGARLVGLAHYLFHRSTTRIGLTCYLQDLFTAKEARNLGVGRALIQATYDAARTAGSSRVYWQTQTSNTTGRALYDKVAKHAGFIVYSQEM